ncbi:SGNH/GDSL hydrolase family protein [bacterium]|nr:MAG: SGNH/GDSL hydrolase family protein [bacterium]
MARLPQPGGDNGNWGDILNDYLAQSHKTDGTLKDDSVTSNTIADNAVTASSLAPNSVTNAALASDSVDATTIADGSITKPLFSSSVQASLDKADTALQSSDISQKADNNSVVHIAGTETITGAKNFTGATTVNGVSLVTTNDARLTDARTPIDNSVTTIKIQDTTVTKAKLETTVQASLTKADSSIAETYADTKYVTQSNLPNLIAKNGGTLLLPNTVALLGDSITMQNSTVDGYKANGYFIWANALLGQRFNFIGQFGASGKTTNDLITEGHVANAANSPASWVIELSGTNSLAASSAQQIADQRRSIWRTLTAAGKRVVVCTITPRDNPGDGQTTWDKVREANRIIISYASSEPGVVLCDWYSTLVNPTTGKVNLVNLYDGVHPNSVGASKMGRFLADTLDSIIPKGNSVFAPDAYDPRSLMPNPFMLGDTSGGATSTNFYAIGSGTYSRSKVPRTDAIPGEWQQLTVTAAPNPATDGGQVQQQNTAVGVDWNVGDTVYGVMEFETDAAGWAGRHLQLSIDFFQGATPVPSPSSLRYGSNEIIALAADPLRPTRGILRTPNAQVTTGATRIQANVYMRGLGTIRVGRLDVIKVV